jgi:hypothetical protein
MSRHLVWMFRVILRSELNRWWHSSPSPLPCRLPSHAKKQRT